MSDQQNGVPPTGRMNKEPKAVLWAPKVDEQCQRSFFLPTKPALDELRRSLPREDGKESKDAARPTTQPAPQTRPISPMVALMLRNDY